MLISYHLLSISGYLYFNIDINNANIVIYKILTLWRLNIDGGINMSKIISEHIQNLIATNRFFKAEISNKLGIGYSTLWRRLNGERSINVDFLSDLAKVLGTTSSYLLGETDNPIPTQPGNNVMPKEENMQLDELSEVSKETLHQETHGHLVFRHGDYCIDVPDTPSNQLWFRELATNILMSSVAIN